MSSWGFATGFRSSIRAGSWPRARPEKSEPTRKCRRFISARAMLNVESINSFYGDAHVLQNVSLSIERGTIVTLLGRNGAGKSTTLKSIMGLVPARSGKIRFDGREISGLPCEEIARLGIAL